jgi:simple sugar transport system ATP-binding protein
VPLRAVAPAVGHLELDAAPTTTAPLLPGRVALSLRDVTTVAPDGRAGLDRFRLDVHRGEIVGLAGAEGNGQTELGDVLSSLVAITSGSVEVCGTPVVTGRAGAMAHAGVGVIPEDRHSASILELSVAENLVAGDIDRVSSGRFVNRTRLRTVAQELVDQFEITVASVDAPMGSLSGGNQQRVVLARELSRTPAVLVAAQPTRGLDVRAIEYMNTRIRAAAASGVAVLLISTELEELIALSHRIAVIHRGHIVGEMTSAELDLQRLGLLMGGRAS